MNGLWGYRRRVQAILCQLPRGAPYLGALVSPSLHLRPRVVPATRGLRPDTLRPPGPMPPKKTDHRALARTTLLRNDVELKSVGTIAHDSGRINTSIRETLAHAPSPRRAGRS